MRAYLCKPLPATDRWAVTFPLFDSEGRPNWMVHPQYGNKVDVVALPINITSEAVPNPINKMASQPLDLQIGMDVFILGYPFGIGATALPIWKRGSIASEPSLIVSQQLFTYIDAASRRGMSGSPVIRRSWGLHSMIDGHFLGGVPRASRFVGIYSGRVGLGENDLQLGLMWSSQFVEEIVARGVRDQITK